MHGVHAAFALDRFKEHSHDVRVAFGGCLQGFDVVDGHADKSFDQRTKPSLYFGVARGAQRGNGATMKSLFVDHDFRALNATVMAELARQLQRRFVRFQAGGAEEDVGHAGALDQQAGQHFLVRHMVVVGGVDQLGQLVLQRRHQLGVVVAQGIDCNPAQRIQIFAPVGIPYAATLAVRHGNGQAAVGVHHVG